jgi:hypothetical protein
MELRWSLLLRDPDWRPASDRSMSPIYRRGILLMQPRGRSQCSGQKRLSIRPHSPGLPVVLSLLMLDPKFLSTGPVNGDIIQ